MSTTPPLLLASGELEVQETHVPIFPGLRPIFPGLRPIRAKARLWRCVGVNEHRIRLWKSLEGRKPFQAGVRNKSTENGDLAERNCMGEPGAGRVLDA